MLDFNRLKEPFPADDIEWRIQEAKKGDKGLRARVLAYVTNRAIMNRLDEVCGPQNWRNEFITGPDGGVMCGVSIYIEDRKEWVTKWDGADNTNIEPVKGGLSGSMKRAAVQWGIGRYLYNLEAGFAKIHDGGEHYTFTKETGAFKWDAPALPAWALPGGHGAPDAAPKARPESRPESRSESRPAAAAPDAGKKEWPSDKMLVEIAAVRTLADLSAWFDKSKAALEKLPEKIRSMVSTAYKDRYAELRDQQRDNPPTAQQAPPYAAATSSESSLPFWGPQC